jgi:hypothetical protein
MERKSIQSELALLLLVLGLIAAAAAIATAATADDLLQFLGVELLHLATPFEFDGL